LNIGGTKYILRIRSIEKHGPNTLLGHIIKRNESERESWMHAYFSDTNELFFERSPQLFEPIFDFYTTGELHFPVNICLRRFAAELKFWRIAQSQFANCCNPALTQQEEEIDEDDVVDESELNDMFEGKKCANIRRRIWNITEGLVPSHWWKVYELTSSSFVLISIAALVMASVPNLQQQVTRRVYFNETQPDGDVTLKSVMYTEMEEHVIFAYIEYVCVVYFLVEFVVRFTVSPDKHAFMRVALNIVDLLAVLPFLLEITLEAVGLGGERIRQVRWAMLTVRVLRVLRVIRIAKLSRFSPGLRNFALTLDRSKKQLQMVAIILFTGVIFFSTLVYFLERDEIDTQFTSIPAAFWWCIVSFANVYNSKHNSFNFL
jgi:hypothetical protein